MVGSIEPMTFPEGTNIIKSKLYNFSHIISVTVILSNKSFILEDGYFPDPRGWRYYIRKWLKHVMGVGGKESSKLEFPDADDPNYGPQSVSKISKFKNPTDNWRVYLGNCVDQRGNTTECGFLAAYNIWKSIDNKGIANPNLTCEFIRPQIMEHYAALLKKHKDVIKVPIKANRSVFRAMKRFKKDETPLNMTPSRHPTRANPLGKSQTLPSIAEDSTDIEDARKSLPILSSKGAKGNPSSPSGDVTLQNPETPHDGDVKESTETPLTNPYSTRHKQTQLLSGSHGKDKKRMQDEIRSKEQALAGKRMKEMLKSTVQVKIGSYVQLQLRPIVDGQPKGNPQRILGVVYHQHKYNGKVMVATPGAIIGTGRGGRHSEPEAFGYHQYAVLDDNVNMPPEYRHLQKLIRDGSWDRSAQVLKSVNKLHEEAHGYKPFARMNSCGCKTSKGCTSGCGCIKNGGMCHSGCNCHKMGLPCLTKNQTQNQGT